MSAILLEQDIVHYEVLGRGRPLVFLHGWVGSWRYWIPVMQVASISFRAYALDLWGFGDSARKQDRYSLDQQIYLLDSFLDRLGIGKVALVGHGLGAMIALQYTLLHPDMVDRVMAVSYPLEENMINSRLRNGSPAELADWLLGRSTITEPMRADAYKVDQAAVQASLNHLGSMQKVLQQMSAPCVLVNGQNDPIVELPRLEQIAGLPEFMHAILFEQSGHFPMLDESNKFNRLMVDFLALPSGESPRQLALKEEWKRRVR
ncbi:MAG: alpha/beta hydrolase [Anaerolineaceae bacterium]